MSYSCPNRIGRILKTPSEEACSIRRNPAQLDDIVSRFLEATPEDLESAILAARDAQPAWGAMTPVARATLIDKTADRLAARRDDLAVEITREEGKPLAEALAEVETAVVTLRYMGSLALRPVGNAIPSARNGVSIWTAREALGVIGIITPWNFPVAIPCAKLGAALAAGNAVIFKPSPYTPLTGWRVVEAFLDAGVPDGVINFLTDQGVRVGREIVTHRGVHGISFTGSTRVGRAIAESAARRLAPCQLELGGKNALIVLGDADLDVAASLAASGAFSGTGQKCTATTRVIVVRDKAGAFLDRLADRVAQIRVGAGLDPGTNMGPVVSEERLQAILAQVAEAERDGARCMLGGRRLTGPGFDSGLFMAPTVLLDVRPRSAIAREEVFGPVLVVLVAGDEVEAMQAANDSTLGLSSAVCTGDVGRALRFAKGLRTGLVNINKATLSMEHQVPAAGWGESGFGAPELGPTALDFYSLAKTVYWNHGAEA